MAICNGEMMVVVVIVDAAVVVVAEGVAHAKVGRVV